MLKNLLRHKDTALAIYITALFAMIFILVPRIMDFMGYSLSVLRFPYVWALTENENMLFIHGLASGQNIYSHNPAGPFFYDVYPPLFHLLAAGLTKLFGLAILIPRLLSIGSFLALSLLIGLFVGSKTRRLENNIISVLLVLFAASIAFYAKYYVLARVDMTAYAFAFGSLFFIWKIVYLKEDKRAYYWLAGGLAIAALFTKQSAFFPYLVMLGSLIYVKDRRTWLHFGAGVAGATILVFLIVQLITQGGFWQSMSDASQLYGKALNSVDHLLRLQLNFAKQYWPLLLSLPALAALAPKSPSILFAIAIYANFLITGGNQGADHNTMIPVLFGLLLVVKELYITQRIGPGVVIVLCALQLVSLQKIVEPFVRPNSVDLTNQQELVEILKTSGQPTVLGDRVDYAIFLAGKNSPLEASTHNVALTWPKTQDYALTAQNDLLERLSSGQIDTVIVASTGFGRKELLTWVEAHSQLIDSRKIRTIDSPDMVQKIYQIDSPNQ